MKNLGTAKAILLSTALAATAFVGKTAFNHHHNNNLIAFDGGYTNVGQIHRVSYEVEVQTYNGKKRIATDEGKEFMTDYINRQSQVVSKGYSFEVQRKLHILGSIRPQTITMSTDTFKAGQPIKSVVEFVEKSNGYVSRNVDAALNQVKK